MHLKHVTFFPAQYPTRDRYPFNQEIFHHTEQMNLLSPVTIFVGENGTGKSTLLEALCRKCGIHIWRGIDRARFQINPYEEQFHKYITIEWVNDKIPGAFFSSELFHNFTQLLDEWAVDDPGMLKFYGGKSLVTQSHGQSLMSYFKMRYQIKGVYLLDEPETALSPKNQLRLLRTLHEMGQAGHAQFILATHSPILMACPGANIYNFNEAPLQQIRYEETEHYQIYKDFMTDQLGVFES